MQAANYLNIKSLLDLTCLTVANMIKGISKPTAPLYKQFQSHTCNSTVPAPLYQVPQPAPQSQFHTSSLPVPVSQFQFHCSSCTVPVVQFQFQSCVFTEYPTPGYVATIRCLIVTGKTPEEIRKTFNIVVSWFYSMDMTCLCSCQTSGML